MKTVYKFCRKHGLEILNNLELKITPPNQFNDPFEFTPYIWCSDKALYLQREAVCRGLYDLTGAKNSFRGSFAKYREMLKLLLARPEAVEKIAEVMKETLPLTALDVLNRVSLELGILCVSRARDSILMWGHYCDNALGLVIGFDESHPIFRLEEGLKPVHYGPQRVVFDACWEEGSDEMKRYEEEIIVSKNADWIYEAEFRQIFRLSSHELKKRDLVNKCTGLKTDAYFLPFPAEAVVSVTLGPRCCPAFQKEVIEVLHQPHFSKVQIERAILKKSDFVLEFEPVKSA
jgi:hypothetical protein